MAGGGWLEAPSDKYGGSMATNQAATPDATATKTVAPSVRPTLAGFISPSDPAFWFAAIAAAGVGLMAYSTVVPG